MTVVVRPPLVTSTLARRGKMKRLGSTLKLKLVAVVDVTWTHLAREVTTGGVVALVVRLKVWVAVS